MAHENELVNVLGLKSSLQEFKNTYILGISQSTIINALGYTPASIDDIEAANTEAVTVTLTCEDFPNTSLLGTTVTIADLPYVVDVNNLVTTRVAYGIEYTVRADGLSGWISPADLKYTASVPSRNILFTYTKITTGTFAYYPSGGVRSFENADSKALGWAIYLSDKKFIVYKNYLSVLVLPSYATVPGITYTTDRNTAKADMNGSSNTDAFLAYSNDSGLYNIKKQFGSKAYLPSLGELNMILMYYSYFLPSYANIIGGNFYYTSSYSSPTFQSSTGYNYASNWTALFANSTVNYSSSAIIPGKSSLILLDSINY